LPSHIPDSIRTLIASVDKPITQRVEKLSNIQSIAKKLLDIAIFNGYEQDIQPDTGEPTHWEHLNNLWSEQAIKYAMTRGLTTRETLERLALEQWEKQKGRAGVHKTKTGRLPQVIWKYFDMEVPEGDVTTPKVKQYTRDFVNPHTRHIYTEKNGKQRLTKREADKIIEKFRKGELE